MLRFDQHQNSMLIQQKNSSYISSRKKYISKYADEMWMCYTKNQRNKLLHFIRRS